MRLSSPTSRLPRGARLCILLSRKTKTVDSFYFFREEHHMWLSRLLGKETDDSEPSRVAPHALAGAAIAAQRRAKSPGIARTVSKPKGFDPYNSGVFRKTSAWERVTKR
jgi:hypothetical protein